MADTGKVKQCFDQYFNKQALIKKAIIASIALLLVLSLSLSFYLWLKGKNDGLIGEDNGFWNIYKIWNPNIGFSINISTNGIYAIQSITFILLLGVFLFVAHDKITASFISLAMFGGLFNLIQRGCSGNNSVLDYFQFGFWKSFPIFNWPDMFVVVGIFGFVISYITLLIIQVVREKNEQY